MKKVITSLLLLLLLINACNSNELNEYTSENSPQSHTMELSLPSGNDITDLQIEGDNMLKSSAVTYSCTVSPGDTIIWKVKTNGQIKIIEKIILLNYDCDNVFKSKIAYKEDSTTCYGVISDNATGTIKYDIEYKTIMDSIVRVDPLIEIEPPE